MKSWIAVLLAGLLSNFLLGCATSGRAYDDSKIAQIHRGATTESQLINWFGSPSSRVLAPDGRKSLLWKFARHDSAHHNSSGRLDVQLDAEGKVVAYSAATNTR